MIARGVVCGRLAMIDGRLLVMFGSFCMMDTGGMRP